MLKQELSEAETGEGDLRAEADLGADFERLVVVVARFFLAAKKIGGGAQKASRRAKGAEGRPYREVGKGSNQLAESVCAFFCSGKHCGLQQRTQEIQASFIELFTKNLDALRQRNDRILDSPEVG